MSALAGGRHDDDLPHRWEHEPDDRHADVEIPACLVTQLPFGLVTAADSLRSDGRRGRRDQEEIRADTPFVGPIFQGSGVGLSGTEQPHVRRR